MQTAPTNNEPRVVHGMSNADYHSLPSVSKSGLDLIRKAPALYKWRREHPLVPTPAMRMGTLVHTAVLEPDTLRDRVMVAPKVDRRSTAGKAEWSAFLIASEGKELVDEDELDKLSAIRDAVWAHPAAGKAMRQIIEVESSIFWDAAGVNCRCRPDAITSGEVIVDLKTTRDASPEGFAKSIAQYRYHVQSAFYSDGFRAAFGSPPKGFVFIAVETEPPFLVGVYVASAAMILRGRSDYEADLATYQRCIDADEWPGYAEQPLMIDLPKWA